MGRGGKGTRWWGEKQIIMQLEKEEQRGEKKRWQRQSALEKFLSIEKLQLSIKIQKPWILRSYLTPGSL